MNSKRFFSLIMAIMVVISTVAISSPVSLAGKPGGGTATSTIKYVTLGDSIATGTTTPLTSPTDPYVDQFERYLVDNGKTVTRKAFETDGDRTNELLSKLKTNSTMRRAVKDANIITVSIGGNNLMQACKTWLGLYDFFDPNIAMADQGYADFAVQWELIMKEIRSLNTKAAVLTMNLYNPYNDGDAYMHNMVDDYYERTDGTGMNDLIGNLATNYNYKVADSYGEFHEYSDGRMGEVTLLYPSSFTRNPHPSQYGQNLITELHRSLYPIK